jgi:hypothetical protein
MLAAVLLQVVRVKEADIACMNKQLDAANNNLEGAHSDLSTARAALKVRQQPLSACWSDTGDPRQAAMRKAAHSTHS